MDIKKVKSKNKNEVDKVVITMTEFEAEDLHEILTQHYEGTLNVRRHNQFSDDLTDLMCDNGIHS